MNKSKFETSSDDSYNDDTIQTINSNMIKNNQKENNIIIKDQTVHYNIIQCKNHRVLLVQHLILIEKI